MHTSTFMPPDKNNPCNATQSGSSAHWLAATAAALLALLPFVVNRRELQALVWFGDEYDLLNQIRIDGFLPWTTSTFAENFVPLFKLLWGGLVFVGGGSYFVMISALWFTHALNAALLTQLMQRLGARPLSALAAATLFAACWSTHETVGWSVQWSAVLCTTFFLSALLLISSASCIPGGGVKRPSFLFSGGLLLCAAASVLSFSRGIAVCAAIALCCGGLSTATGTRSERVRWLTTGALCLAPALIAAAILFVMAQGNHHQLLSGEGESLRLMGEFAATAFSFNPLHKVLRLNEPVISLGMVEATVKALVFALGLWCVRGNRVHLILLLTLCAFDLGNATLMGIGRHHTGTSMALSSRYQYEFLLIFCTFLSIVLTATVSRLRYTQAVECGAGLALLCLSAWPWPETAKTWADWRGRQGTAAIMAVERGEKFPASGRWIGIPGSISEDDLRELRRRFSLH